MTVYCPKCGSDDIDALEGPHTVEETETAVLLTQQDRCNKCRHVWMDKWWKCWDADDGCFPENDDEGQDGEI